MSDWVVPFSAVVLLPIVLLLVFVGCATLASVEPWPEGESTGTTTGGDPDLIAIEVHISAMCDAAANAITIFLTSDITNQPFSTTLTSIPSEAFTISTKDLHITLQGEGQVSCAGEISLADGESLTLPAVKHAKDQGQLVEPFTLTCSEGVFELT